MRVLFLSPGAFGVNGGIAQHDRDVVEALVSMRQIREIILLPRTLASETGPLPAKVRHVAGAASGKVAYVWRFLVQMRNRVDLVLCGHINLLPLAALAKFRSACPMALMVHGIDVWERPKGIAPALAGLADRIWPVSHLTRERMDAWAKLPDECWAVLPNPVRLERYGMAPGGERLRQRYGLDGRKVLLTLARLPGFDRYKGVDEILEILPALRAEVPGIAYVVAGDGPDRPRLEQKARALGLGDIVRFAGHVAEEEKADHYRLADVFVMPGRAEGFGYVYLEALACGVPVVGSAIDGSREALRGGMLGELPDPRNHAEIKVAIMHSLAKAKGIPAGLEHFAWPNFKARLAGEIERLTHARRKAKLRAARDRLPAAIRQEGP